MRFIPPECGHRIRGCIRCGSLRTVMWTERGSRERSLCCRMSLPRRRRRAHERKKHEAAGSFCLRSCSFGFCWGIGGRTVDGRKRAGEESFRDGGGGAEIYRGRGATVV